MNDNRIRVSAVVLWNSSGQVLTVRKQGTGRFMLPGGKPEPGETPRQTGSREIAEEVGLVLDEARLVDWGDHEESAANEPGHTVCGHVFAWPEPVRDVSAAAEISEVRWQDPSQPGPDLAPLLVSLLPRIAREAPR
ncbi:MAG: NUDIX domain-containing protein [Actinomycetia bacterium]|nr:NUDIX domain-containing protein [Actinomycetes bacterium]